VAYWIELRASGLCRVVGDIGRDDKSAPGMIQSLWQTPAGQAAPLRLVKPVNLKS
jgi:hypothetical protein